MEAAFARGAYGLTSSKQEAENQAKQQAVKSIFKRLNALVSSINCPIACNAKVYSYWMGDTSYETNSNVNLQGQTVYKSIVTIPSL